jgi:hypothetical protein
VVEWRMADRNSFTLRTSLLVFCQKSPGRGPKLLQSWWTSKILFWYLTTPKEETSTLWGARDDVIALMYVLSVPFGHDGGLQTHERIVALLSDTWHPDVARFHDAR